MVNFYDYEIIIISKSNLLKIQYNAFNPYPKDEQLYWS